MSLHSFYKNKKVLITGHTGFKGSWFTEILLLMGAHVSGISLVPTSTPNLFTLLGLEKRCSSYIADIRNREEMLRIISKEKPEIIFHLAAQPIVRTSYDDPLGTISTNVNGTANILDVVREVGFVKSVVIITTDKVYENKEWHYAYRENDPLGGHDPYSSSKAAADIISYSYIQSFFNPENFEKTHNTLVAIARAGNVIGGGDWSEYRLIPDVIRATYHHGKHVEIRNPDSVRPWQHVLEPISGYLMLGKELYEKKTLVSGAWNFGPHNDSFVSVRALAEGAQEILGKGGFIITPDTSKHEANLLKLDINKAIALLGWKPVLSFKETLELTFLWYKEYYESKGDMVAFTNRQIKHFFKI